MTTPSALQQRMASYLERDGYEITFEDSADTSTMTNRVTMRVKNPDRAELTEQAWLVSYTNIFTNRTRHYAGFYSPYSRKPEGVSHINPTQFSFYARMHLGATK